jgi:hypothetical protein
MKMNNQELIECLKFEYLMGNKSFEQCNKEIEEKGEQNKR